MGRIEDFLADRIASNLLRTLAPACRRADGVITLEGKEYFDFCSNDYLGLASHPALIKASTGALAQFGAGSCASRLLSGDLELTHRLEDELAGFKGKEAALVFNSGYQANVGIVSTLCQKGDVVFSDKLNHASIIDGITLSGSKLIRFFHNDTTHLAELLARARRNYNEALIITESIFSMEGDAAPLAELVRLKEKYQCRLMIDEAHATGIFGSRGAGLAEELGVSSQVDLIMGTFGKALGSFGAYLACARNIKEFLVNKCRSFIYTTALPPAVVAANIASLAVIRSEPDRRLRLRSAADRFRRLLRARNFDVRGDSQIVPVVLADVSRTIAAAAELRSRGYWVLPIRPPTVGPKESRLRFSLSFYHTDEVLKNVADELAEIIPV